MEPGGRVKVDREKQRTLSEVCDSFEELASRFAQCQNSLVQGQPLEGPRREVDSVLSIQAGIFVLIALDQGYLKCSNSSSWNPWEQFRAHISELSNIRKNYTERDKQRSELPECLPEQNDIVASYYSGDDFVVLEKVEPIPPSQRLQVLDKLLQQFEESLDPFSEAGQMTVLNAWSAFLGLELIPQNEMDFRCDWRDRLPMLFDRSMLDSRTNTPRNKTWKAPGKTQDEQFRYCIQARADIYATACRIIAKLLRAEIDSGQSENGGKAGHYPPLADKTASSFEVQSEFVRICGFGEDVQLERTAGVDRLIAIVTSRKRRVSVWELVKIGAKQESADSESDDWKNSGLVEHETLDDDDDEPVLGADANQAVKEAVGKLIAQKKDAQASGDLTEAKRLKEQIDAALEPYKKSLKDAAKTVGNSLNRTYQRLRKESKRSLLASHFERYVKRLHKESDFVYVPDEHAGKIDWKSK